MKGTILVGDDDEETSRLLTETLTQGSFRVAQARGGRDVLLRVEQEPPDVVVWDVFQKGMGGMETLKRVRERARDLRVVVLTASGTAERVREARALGVSEFLGKPFDPRRLFRIVAEEMGDAAPRDEWRPCDG